MQICTSSILSAFFFNTSKEIQICTLALTHYFYAHFLCQYSSKFKYVLRLNPMIFLLISFMYMLANPNLYLVSIPWFFCLFPSCIKRSPNLYFSSHPSFFSLIPLYTFREWVVKRIVLANFGKALAYFRWRIFS